MWLSFVFEYVDLFQIFEYLCLGDDLNKLQNIECSLILLHTHIIWSLWSVLDSNLFIQIEITFHT